MRFRLYLTLVILLEEMYSVIFVQFAAALQYTRSTFFLLSLSCISMFFLVLFARIFRRFAEIFHTFCPTAGGRGNWRPLLPATPLFLRPCT